jgi:hypothetical protein
VWVGVKEIYDSLTRIMNIAIKIHNSNMPPQFKADAAQIFINSLHTVTVAFSPEKLFELIREESNKKLIKRDEPYG